jgi:translation initiation factor IF-3
MIRSREVRVVDSGGEQVGVVPLEEALRLAESQNLDLVEVAAAANPPVCRVMDFGKYQYMQKKKAQESRRKQTTVVLKEVKIRSRTDQHDVGFKVGHIRRFLEKGNRVKVSVFFRGREITHPELGQEMLKRVYEGIKDLAQIDIQARLEGRHLSMLVSPRK